MVTTEGENTEDSSYLNKSLDKALSILDLFDSENPSLSVTEIANKYDTNPSSLYPILHTLEKHGYLSRDEDKSYSLGLAFAKKSRLVLDRLNLSVEARSELENLRDKTQKTVHLGYLNEAKVVYIDKVESKGGIKLYSSPGKTAPIHATSLGKVILAYLPDEKVEEILTVVTLNPETANTITSTEELMQELEEINQQGYALDNEEFEEGIKCIASPIFNHDGEVEAAVSITGLAAQMKNEDIESLVPLVKNSAKKISAKLGHE